MFIKLMGFHDNIDGELCPGHACPIITIVRNDGSSEMATCFDAAYTGDAPYKKTDTVSTCCVSTCCVSDCQTQKPDTVSTCCVSDGQTQKPDSVSTSCVSDGQTQKPDTVSTSCVSDGQTQKPDTVSTCCVSDGQTQKPDTVSTCCVSDGQTQKPDSVSTCYVSDVQTQTCTFYGSLIEMTYDMFYVIAIMRQREDISCFFVYFGPVALILNKHFVLSKKQLNICSN